NKTNPAFTGQNGFYLGLPSVYFSYWHTAGSVDDLIRKEGGKNILDVSRLIRNADDDNSLNMHFELESFNLQFALGKFAIGVNHAVKSNIWLQYSETLPKLFWEGNGQYVGQEIFFGPDQQSFAYNEWGLSAAYELGPLRVGGRVKLLNGIGDVSTDRTLARLQTDDDIYQLSLATDYRVNSSTFSNKILFDSLSGIGVEYGLDELFNYDGLFSSSMGVAFDLGIQYQLNDRLEVAVSLLDIGRINWDEKLNTLSSQGTFRYDGIEFSNIFQDEELSFEGTLDTLEEIFSFEESSDEYSTSLPAKLYASAMYQLNDRLRLGAMYHMEKFRGRERHAIAVSADAQLLPQLRVGAMYALRNDTYDNLGLNVNYLLGPVRLFAMTDNVLAVVRPFDSQNVNGRLGLALELGALFQKEKTLED
ncbi:MAG: DUF5723 family protein, partial [Bacteroidota bacterium]